MYFERPIARPRQIPIVSLIDILFIVLIFFIVSSEFKKKRNVLQVELPTVREVKSETIADARSVLSIDAEGVIQIDSVTVSHMSLLKTYLDAYRDNNPGRKLELEADKDVSLEQLVAVWDALTKAGFDVKDVPARIQLPMDNATE